MSKEEHKQPTSPDKGASDTDDASPLDGNNHDTMVKPASFWAKYKLNLKIGVGLLVIIGLILLLFLKPTERHIDPMQILAYVNRIDDILENLSFRRVYDLNAVVIVESYTNTEDLSQEELFVQRKSQLDENERNFLNWFDQIIVPADLPPSFSGILTHKFEDVGFKSIEIPFKNGKPHGQIIFRYNDGSNALTANFNHGVKEDEVHLYYSTGTPCISAIYSNGLLNGNYKLLSKDGTPLRDFQYSDGEKVGAQFEYHLNGLPYVESNYKNGKLSGEQRV